MRRRSSYDPYRGRSPLRTLLKIVAVVLAVVLVVSVVVLYFLDPYWTYTPDGPRLQLPWEDQEEPSAAPSSTPPPSPGRPSGTPPPSRPRWRRPGATPLSSI